MLIFVITDPQGWLGFVLFLIAYLTIGYDILIKACKGIRNKQPFDENFLMAVATLGAMGLGDYKEAAAVMLFYQTGELFQSIAVGRSRRNISQLMDIRPDYANIENADGELEQVDPDEVAIGSIIVVKPGEKIPIDGTIVEGSTTLDTAALTGESVPRDAKCGDEALSGCINLSGVIKIKTSREFGESTVSKILDLVENASSKKSRSEAFITRFARVYTPAVCAGALALAIIPPVVSLAMGNPSAWDVWLYRALTFLVISCPCALVISIPLTFFAGIGGASNAGVLVKGSNYLEGLSEVRHVVFDKTGTLTKGVFEVSGVYNNTVDEAALLEYAAYAECYSDHPISKSLKAAYGKTVDPERVADVHEISGNGVTAVFDGKSVAAGNARLMSSLGIKVPPCDEPGTLVHVAVNGTYCGVILISDKLKDGARMQYLLSSKAALKRPSCSRATLSVSPTQRQHSSALTRCTASCCRPTRSARSRSF